MAAGAAKDKPIWFLDGKRIKQMLKLHITVPPDAGHAKWAALLTPIFEKLKLQ